MTLWLDETAHYDVAVHGDHVMTGPRRFLRRRPGGHASPGGPRQADPRHGSAHHGPDTVSLGFEDEHGAAHTLGQLDGRSVSTEVTGGFLGRMLALYAVGGEAFVDWFEYEVA